jgi:hypothetical protein
MDPETATRLSPQIRNLNIMVSQEISRTWGQTFFDLSCHMQRLPLGIKNINLGAAPARFC